MVGRVRQCYYRCNQIQCDLACSYQNFNGGNCVLDIRTRKTNCLCTKDNFSNGGGYGNGGYGNGNGGFGSGAGGSYGGGAGGSYGGGAYPNTINNPGVPGRALEIKKVK